MPLFAGYPALEVMDTSELDSLETLLTKERHLVTERRTMAKEQQRKVLRVECDLDLKRIDKLLMWMEHARKDGRRTW